jgi:hypothetical protein
MVAGRKLDMLGMDEVFGEPRHFEHATGPAAANVYVSALAV